MLVNSTKKIIMFLISAGAGLLPRPVGINLPDKRNIRLRSHRRKDYDSFWKYLIEEMFEFFFRFFKPRLAQHFDLDHVEFLDKEQGKIFPDDNTNVKTRFVDKLIKVYRKNSQKRFVIFHVEVQGSANRHFPERMFEYFHRLRSRYKSPVNALAIITGGGTGSHPKYEHLYDETKISYEYSVYQVREQSEKELLKSSNPFAFVILIAQKGLAARNWTDEETIDYFGSLAKTIESRNLPVNHLNMLYGFMNECISFANPEYHAVFNHILETITKRKNPMGLKEELMDAGRLEGVQKGRLEVIAELLKNDRYDLQEIARTVHLSKEEVLKIRKLIARQKELA